MEDKFDPLLNYISSKLEIKESEKELIKSSFEVEHIPKGTVLLEKGQISRYIYFINSGILRTYYLTKFGNESTRIIALENNFCGSLSSFIQKIPGFEFIEALEDSEVIKINKEKFDYLIDHAETFHQFYRIILEEIQIFNMWRIESFISMDAKDRFLFLMDMNPEVINSVSNKVLATYLGIKPETLSRIKSSKIN